MPPSAAAAARRVRVVSFNICGFGAGFGPVDAGKVTETYGRLREDIQRLKPDVLCLQEAKRMPLQDPAGRERGDTLEALAQDLGGMALRFAHANPGFESFGNALLVGSRVRLEGGSAEFLEGGSVIRTPAGAEKKIGRGCLAALLSAEQAQSKFAVLVTHWDHISEGERLTQARSLLQLRPSLCEGLPHLLVGDLNAMKRSDYSEEEWSAFEERNRQKGWGPPADSDALALLEGEGYIDVLQSSWGRAEGEATRWTVAGPPGARIDYALASGDWKERAGGTYSAWVDTEASSSDHFPLVVDLLLL